MSAPLRLLGRCPGRFYRLALDIGFVEHPFEVLRMAVLQVFQRLAFVCLELQVLLEKLHARLVVVYDLRPSLDENRDVAIAMGQARRFVRHALLCERAITIADHPKDPIDTDAEPAASKAFILLYATTRFRCLPQPWRTS